MLPCDRSLATHPHACTINGNQAITQVDRHPLCCPGDLIFLPADDRSCFASCNAVAPPTCVAIPPVALICSARSPYGVPPTVSPSVTCGAAPPLLHTCPQAKYIPTPALQWDTLTPAKPSPVVAPPALPVAPRATAALPCVCPQSRIVPVLCRSSSSHTRSC